MNALELADARTIAIALVLGLVVLSAISALVIKAIVAKVISIVVLLALAGVVWGQRAALQDCADDLRNEVVGGAGVTCTLFGIEVDVPGVDVPGGGESG